MPRCSASGCRNMGSHTFPKDPTLRILWENATNKENFKASKHSRLCYDHFKPSDYIDVCLSTGMSPYHRCLKKTAVPSIFSVETPKLRTSRASEIAEKTPSITMPLTGAEKTRRYRERLKNERPDILLYACKKHWACKKNGRKKSNNKKITAMTSEEAERQRKKSREQKRKSSKKKQKKNITKTTKEECKNTTIKTPKKLWIVIPSDDNIRNTWLKLAKRDPITLSAKTQMYFCEDHFNLENAMENYMEYKIMGSVKKIRMKPDCIPTRFQCQTKIKNPLIPNKDDSVE